MSLTFEYRRTAPIAEAMKIGRECIMAFNRTPWKCHAPQTVYLQSLEFQQDPPHSDTCRLRCRFAFGKPDICVDRGDGTLAIFQVCQLRDFNDFDFGELYEPDPAAPTPR